MSFLNLRVFMSTYTSIWPNLKRFEQDNLQIKSQGSIIFVFCVKEKSFDHIQQAQRISQITSCSSWLHLWSFPGSICTEHGNLNKQEPQETLYLFLHCTEFFLSHQLCFLQPTHSVSSEACQQQRSGSIIVSSSVLSYGSQSGLPLAGSRKVKQERHPPNIS